jgi:hypothetical protein
MQRGATRLAFDDDECAYLTPACGELQGKIQAFKV